MIIRYLIIIVAFSFLTSCKQSKGLEGLWFNAYSKLENGEPSYKFDRVFVDFKKHIFYSIQVGDRATGDLDKISIDTIVYNWKKGILLMGRDSVQCLIHPDSLVLTFPDSPDYKHVLFRVNSSEIANNVNKCDFSGAYILANSKSSVKDTISILNDSIILHTGKYDVNHPVDKWSFFNYDNLTFFTFNGDFQWIAPIGECSKDTIVLSSLYDFETDILLYRYESIVNKSEELLGTWQQVIPDSLQYPLPPLPPGMTEDAKFIKMTFDTDSVTITKYGRAETLKWNLTSDGKRIYFPDKLLDKWGSGKIISLSRHELVLHMAGAYPYEDFIKLRRVQ